MNRGVKKMRKEYDFSKGVRGVHASRYAEGVEIRIDGSTSSVPKKPADTQLIELAGRHLVISQMTSDGLQVAIPVRDHGVDLVAYSDKDLSGHFLACPIQLKVGSGRRFGLDRKYQSFSNLLIVYVWDVNSATKQTTIYALTYQEAEEIFIKKGHHLSASWKENDAYSIPKPDKRLLDLLTQYEMRPGKWKACVERALKADLRRSA